MAFLRNIITAIKKRLTGRKKKKHKRIAKKKIFRRRSRRISPPKSRRLTKAPPRRKKQKKAARKKTIKKTRAVSVPKKVKKAKGNPPIGEVTHFFSRIGVCVVKITAGRIALGDKLEIRGHTTRLVQDVRSLQIENADVQAAGKGELAGLKVDKKVRSGDKVFRLSGN